MDTDYALRVLNGLDAREVEVFTNAEKAVKRAADIYQQATTTIRNALERLRAGEDSDSVSRTKGYYPLFAVPVSGKEPDVPASASSGFCHRLDRLYLHTASRVEMRYEYYVKNLSAIMQAHGAPVLVGRSNTPIPVETVSALDEDSEEPWLDRFTRFSYHAISKAQTPPDDHYFLSPYEGLLFDYYHECLRHYTGTDPADFQRFVVLFNYRKYEPEIQRIGQQLVEGKFKELPELGNVKYSELVQPRGYQENSSGYEQEFQMPAYHLKRPDGNGVSFVNIGVGAPSAVTLTEAVCALRPHLVLVAGHCGGMAFQQKIGNFVLGSSFHSFCGATQREIPEEMDVASLGEVQQSARLAIQDVYDFDSNQLANRVESAIIASLDYRHWVVRPEWYSRIAATGAAAVDMETAEVARCCRGNRTPYGFVGMLTDIPPYDRPKLPGPARKLYNETRRKFVLVPLRTCEILANEMVTGKKTPHSRKLVAKFFPPGEIKYRCEIPYPFS